MWSVILDFLSIVFVLILYPLSFEIYSIKKFESPCLKFNDVSKKKYGYTFQEASVERIKKFTFEFFYR